MRQDRRAPDHPPLEKDPVIEAYKEGVDRTLLRENLRRTIAERLSNLVARRRLAEEAGRAGRPHSGRVESAAPACDESRKPARRAAEGP